VNSLLSGLGRLWLRSLRVHWASAQKLPDRAVVLLWHEHLPACIRAFSHRGIGVLISKSRDGDWAAEACKRFGYRVHRGSSTRGGAAGMRSLVRGLESGNGLAGMALDGPRGPRREVKPGSLWLARLAGIPVVPVSIKAPFSFRLGSWDRCLVPLPFSRIEVRMGPPFHPKGIADVEAAMRALEIPISPADIYIPVPH
jgi:lysophospholipid acyltransferase (LPLAT)-like uncharacterized protein